MRRNASSAQECCLLQAAIIMVSVSASGTHEEYVALQNNNKDRNRVHGTHFIAKLQSSNCCQLNPYIKKD